MRTVQGGEFIPPGDQEITIQDRITNYVDGLDRAVQDSKACMADKEEIPEATHKLISHVKALMEAAYACGFGDGVWASLKTAKEFDESFEGQMSGLSIDGITEYMRENMVYPMPDVMVNDKGEFDKTGWGISLAKSMTFRFRKGG